MDTIEIPYMPISSFKKSAFCEKLEKSVQQTEELNETANENSLFALKNGQPLEVALAIHGMGMEKYTQLFENENVSLDTLLELNDSDLVELGITDPGDREIILKNIEIYERNKMDDFVPENHFDDLKIAKNIFNQLLLIQNYCAYIDLQLKKHTYVDYRIINWKHSACEYLRAFTKCAFIQSQILSRSLFDKSQSDHLIGKMIKINNLVLPNHLQEKLKCSKKGKKRSKIVKIMTVMGICILLLVTGKKLIKRF